MKIRLLQPGGLLWRGLIAAFYRLMWLWMATVRVRLIQRVTFVPGDSPLPALCVFWHNRLLAMPFLFPEELRRLCWALASRSQDGQLIADFLAHAQIRAIRGSSMKKGRDKGGAEAYRAMLHLLKEQQVFVSITPDGPRGPRYRAQPGVMSLAAKTGVSVVPITINMPWRLALPTWDRIQIPLPFSKVEVIIGEVLRASGDLPQDTARLEAALAALTVD